MKQIAIDWWLVIIIFLGIVLRIILSPLGFHGDIIMQAGWGQWIFDHGMRGFYENKTWIYGWPNHPPIVSWFYGLGFYIYQWLHTLFILGGSFIANHHMGAGHIPWFYQFVQWWGQTKYIDTPFQIGELISMKLLPIGGDIILAYLIYLIVNQKTGKYWGKIAATIYLFSPFSWYESALWGQNDQLGLILLLGAFWFISQKKLTWLSPIFLAISILVKPTAFIFCPLFAWLAIKNLKTINWILVGTLLAFLSYSWLIKTISPLDFWDFNVNLQKQIFVKGEIWTWVNTFNFWRLITGYLTDYHRLFLSLNLKYWGYILFLGVNVLAFRVCRHRTWDEILKALFIVSCGAWMTMVTMHERYLFPAVVIGLILAVQNRRLLPYWFGLSLIFVLNMFNGWWYPDGLTWLKDLLTWGNFFDGPVPKILSGLNLGLMIVMVKILLKRPTAS